MGHAGGEGWDTWGTRLGVDVQYFLTFSGVNMLSLKCLGFSVIKVIEAILKHQ